MRVSFLLLLAVFAAGGGQADAQDLGWLFATPGRGVHHDRRPHSPLPADVPLPIPRPDLPAPLAPEAVVASPAAAPQRSTPPAAASDAEAQSTAAPPLPPVKPAELAPAPAKPGNEVTPSATGAASRPAVSQSGATTAFDPRLPAPDIGCTERLKARGVAIEPATLPPQPDPRCVVAQPVHLLSVTLADGTATEFPEKPTVACITADAFSAYIHDLLEPLARGTWGSGVSAVWTGPGLECRPRDHMFGAKLSAHGQGLAVDIAHLKLADGRAIAVGAPNTETERDFETAARAGGCGYFHTVLGPGSDSYHRTHWHFDLEVRGRDGDAKYCK